MALGKGYESQDCGLARALELVGERWTLLVVRDAFYGVRRYGDFLAHLGAPRAVLATRLQALTDAGVLERRRYQDSPPRDEYLLTELGRRLWPVLLELSRWGDRLAPNPGGTRRLFFHTECGAGLGPFSTCPGCGGREVPPTEVETRLGPGADPSRRTDPVSRALTRPHRLLTPLLPEEPERPQAAETAAAVRPAGG
ncbi:winged helix-turn-helix transcriptional regulator [Allostreptomyces psammosilenae]|uniref:DNA-binding HxlR family transcriptional regulator n=1 Tax=Allostreptomyces psammosilenae TaxID=1892865 RepID=A0A852ZWS3_9ACTN|nr:helix-turn-helix domain-containing protein [Allostreptomyces psammosilenae]NYI06435.1 DNA-binding HxlR family transcriptional regulator [Allostreptomyces psammosilenae]